MIRLRGWEQKFIFISLALLLAVSIVALTACGDDNKDTPTPTKTTIATVKPPPTINPPPKTTVAPPATTVAPPPPAGTLTIKSKIGDLAANPDAKKIVLLCTGGVTDLDSARSKPTFGLTLPALIPLTATRIPAEKITQEMVDCVDAGLQALAAGTLDAWLASKQGGTTPPPTTVAPPPTTVAPPPTTVAPPPTTTPPPATTPPATTPADLRHKGNLTMDSMLNDLIANPDTNALLIQCLGAELMSNPAIPAVGATSSLPALAAMSDKVTPAMLDCVRAGLAAMPE